MHIGIVFNESSHLWEKEFEFNKLFAKTQLMYLTELYRVKGYLYLNTIYEIFGLRWNPYDKNSCWIYERDGEFEPSIIYNDASGDKITIDITFKTN